MRPEGDFEGKPPPYALPAKGLSEHSAECGDLPSITPTKPLRPFSLWKNGLYLSLSWTGFTPSSQHRTGIKWISSFNPCLRVCFGRGGGQVVGCPVPVTMESRSFSSWLYKLVFMSEGSILNEASSFYYLPGYLIWFNYAPLCILGDVHFFSLVPEIASHNLQLVGTMIHWIILNLLKSLKLYSQCAESLDTVAII